MSTQTSEGLSDGYLKLLEPSPHIPARTKALSTSFWNLKITALRLLTAIHSYGGLFTLQFHLQIDTGQVTSAACMCKSFPPVVRVIRLKCFNVELLYLRSPGTDIHRTWFNFPLSTQRFALHARPSGGGPRRPLSFSRANAALVPSLSPRMSESFLIGPMDPWDGSSNPEMVLAISVLRVYGNRPQREHIIIYCPRSPKNIRTITMCNYIVRMYGPTVKGVELQESSGAAPLVVQDAGWDAFGARCSYTPNKRGGVVQGVNWIRRVTGQVSLADVVVKDEGLGKMNWAEFRSLPRNALKSWSTVIYSREIRTKQGISKMQQRKKTETHQRSKVEKDRRISHEENKTCAYRKVHKRKQRFCTIRHPPCPSSAGPHANAVHASGHSTPDRGIALQQLEPRIHDTQRGRTQEGAISLAPIGHGVDDAFDAAPDPTTIPSRTSRPSLQRDLRKSVVRRVFSTSGEDGSWGLGFSDPPARAVGPLRHARPARPTAGTARAGPDIFSFSKHFDRSDSSYKTLRISPNMLASETDTILNLGVCTERASRLCDRRVKDED
ncbi:hypothetical protein DFH06DRAFT_1132098 [Mycena polygramma]|nr:hypothetical protein DFH06DRAFT_1132098 [Mycena polygramma]